MVQNNSWEWLLEGFKIDLETQVKPKTIKDYCGHVSYFARWAQGNNKRDPRSITKRDIQEFLHFVASTEEKVAIGSSANFAVTIVNDLSHGFLGTHWVLCIKNPSGKTLDEFRGEADVPPDSVTVLGNALRSA